MTRHEDLLAIRKIERQYETTAERWELEDWICQQLFDLYHGEVDEGPIIFRFGEAVIMFAPSLNLFNVTRIYMENVIESSISISMFLEENYGIKQFAEAKPSVQFSDTDFELMAIQITEEILSWYENMTLVYSASQKGIL